MALSEEEKKEMVEIIRQELSNFIQTMKKEIPTNIPPGLDVRSLGTPLSGLNKRPPMAADQCCNGCD
jgi:hypothetical protein